MGRRPIPRLEGESRPQDVETLQESHHVVLRMLVKGRTVDDIAAVTGFTEPFISSLRNSPIAQQQLSVLRLKEDVATINVNEIIARCQPKAALLLEEVINGEHSARLELRVNTAKHSLAQGGHGPIQKVHGTVSYGLDQETLALIKDRANEARATMVAEEAAFEEVGVVQGGAPQAAEQGTARGGAAGHTQVENG